MKSIKKRKQKERTELLRLVKNQNTVLQEIYENAQKNEVKEKKDVRFLQDLVVLKEELEGYVVASSMSESDSRELMFFIKRVERLLEKRGIQKYQTDAEENFDGDRHEWIGSVNTTNPALDVTIARTLRAGYLFQGEILTKELVEVYQTE